MRHYGRAGAANWVTWREQKSIQLMQAYEMQAKIEPGVRVAFAFCARNKMCLCVPSVDCRE